MTTTHWAADYRAVCDLLDMRVAEWATVTEAGVVAGETA